MVGEQEVIPEWEQLGIPVDNSAEPEDAGPTHSHDQSQEVE